MLPSEYGREMRYCPAMKTSPTWLNVISVLGSSSITRLTDWMQAPSKFCNGDQIKQVSIIPNSSISDT